MEPHLPPHFDDLPPRELARLSQTDVTLDPEVGLAYAAAAYDCGMQPNIAAEDPTLAGEAAAKAGLRAEQANRDFEEVNGWFTKSFAALESADPIIARARRATHLLYGRTGALQLLKDNPSGSVHEVSSSFAAAISRDTPSRLRRIFGPFDPYDTMRDKHWATHEAMNGKAAKGSKIALRGIHRAILSKRETANTSEIINEPRPFKKHAHFVIKQAGGNVMAGILAATRPLGHVQRLQKTRKRLAISILG